jgi:hypothetical protein
MIASRERAVSFIEHLRSLRARRQAAFRDFLRHPRAAKKTLTRAASKQ